MSLILLSIVLACQNSNDQNWITFEAQDGSSLHNEPTTIEGGAYQSSKSLSHNQDNKVTSEEIDDYSQSTFTALSDWLKINQFLSDNQGIRITAENLQYKGFDLELHYPHPRQSLRLESSKGTFSTKINQSGNFHIAALIYDSSGKETYSLSINDNFIGNFTADTDNNQEYLFLTNNHFKLEEDDEIIFSSKTENEITPSFSHLAHRVEAIVIIPAMTKVPQSIYPYEIKNVNLRKPDQIYEANDNNIYLTWTTNWQTRCTIFVDQGNKKTTNIKESHAWNNHRAIIPVTGNLAIYQVKISCTSKNGDVNTDWINPISNIKSPNNTNYEVTFSVNNNSNIETNMIPVTVSLPISKSKWWVNSFTLLDQNQKNHVFQSSPLSYWDDGSIKWLLIELLANIKPNKEKIFSLSGNSSYSSNKYPDICLEKKDSVILNNGKIKIVVTPSSIPFDSIYFDTNFDGTINANELISHANGQGFISILSNTGNRFSDYEGYSTYKVVRNGPISCLITVKNSLKYHKGSQIESDFEIELYKNQNWIGLNSTVGFNGNESKTIFKSIDLHFPLENQNPINYSLGTESSPFKFTEHNIQLLQENQSRWIIKSDDSKIIEGGKAPGWASINFKNHHIKLSVKDFWQQWPKSISVNDNTLHVGLFPQINKNSTQPQDNIELTKSLYFFDEENYVMPRGLRKTHKLTLSFGNNNTKDSTHLKLKGKATPNHIAATKAIGSVAEFKSDKFPFYHSIFNEMLNSRLTSIIDNNEYGIINYGDWWGERGVNWGNNEYDTPHGLFQNWLLGGPQQSFELAENAVTHMKNIDVINYGSNDQIGKMYKHSIGHLGNWFATPIKGEKVKKGFYKSQYSVGHTWIDGLLDHYHLTGDTSSFSTAIKIADNLAQYETINYDYTTAREVGSFLLIMTSAYKSTNDNFYLNAATIAFDRLIQRENIEKKGWDRILTSEECNANPPQLGEKSFMIGLLLSGLKQYHIITKNNRAANMIIDASNRLVNENWNDNLIGFKYSTCKTSSSPTDLNWIILDGLGYAWQLTENLKFANPIFQNSILTESFADGKGFSSTTRFAQQILNDRVSALNNLFNVYSKNNIHLNLYSSRQKSIVLFSSSNKEKDNFSIIISNDNNFEKNIQLTDGFASIVLDTGKDNSYKIEITSKDKSGINILSNSTSLNLVVNKPIVLIGQKAARTFWLNSAANDSFLNLELQSSKYMSIKLIDLNEKLIEKCESTKCKITLNTKTGNIKNPIRIEIQNDSDATLNINKETTLLSSFKNQL